jgi:hypothetical protein
MKEHEIIGCGQGIIEMAILANECPNHLKMKEGRAFLLGWTADLTRESFAAFREIVIRQR